MDSIITVALIEELDVKFYTCSSSKDDNIDILFEENWNPSKFLSDENGQRLIEEVARRLRDHWKKMMLNLNKSQFRCLVLSKMKKK